MNTLLTSERSLVLILLSAVLFTIGWRLAVGKHYDMHRWVQTVAVILNAIPVIGFMIGSFLTNILPGIPGKLNEGSYGITTVHAVIGMCAFVLGVFVCLRGNNLVPGKLRFTNYKGFMRVSYGLYMIATVMGVVVYVLRYIVGVK